MYYFTGSSSIRFLFEYILQLLYPMGTYCICCGKYINLTRTYCLCDQCMTAINWGHIFIDLEEERREAGRTEYLDSALSCMVYGLHSRRLIFDLKYNRKTFMARPISMIMADRLASDESLRETAASLDYVVPVPLHAKKKKSRGFNQTELIGSSLTSRLNVLRPAGSKRLLFLPGCLIRRRQTQAQRSVTGEERFANLQGAFAFNENFSDQIKGSSVLLLDDIFTTGATADCCARLLKEHGAGKVHFISLATGNDYLKGSFRERDDEAFLKYL